MLAIGRALMLRPSLLLLDEPSLGLAPLVTRELFEIVRAVNEEERTTVIVVERSPSSSVSSTPVTTTCCGTLHDRAVNVSVVGLTVASAVLALVTLSTTLTTGIDVSTIESVSVPPASVTRVTPAVSVTVKPAAGTGSSSSTVITFTVRSGNGSYRSSEDASVTEITTPVV